MICRINYDNPIDAFNEKLVKRYVRDDLMIAQQGNQLFTVYDWPKIEEVRAFAHKTDPRIALLTRNVFDYIRALEKQGENHIQELFTGSPEELAKPKKLIHVTYGSDVSGLEVPFDPKTIEFLFYSQAKNGLHLFTVNLGFSYLNGEIHMTEYPENSEKIGQVAMKHEPKSLAALLKSHIARVGKQKLVTDDDLCEKAREAFDNIMRYSSHVC